MIQSCIANNVPILIYTSSIDALHEGTMGAYGESKRQAEKLILQANKTNLPNGKHLLTCAIRPTVMYGEGDPNLLTNLIPVVQTKRFVRIGDDNCRFQVAYAGNVAHCFILAICRLLHPDEDESNSPAGKAIGATDDTPLQSYNKQLEPYVESLGAKTSSFYIPFIILIILATICECFVFLTRPFYRFRFTLTRDKILYLQQGPVLNDQDAKQFLRYQPIYSYENSLKRTINYWKEIVKTEQS